MLFDSIYQLETHPTPIQIVIWVILYLLSIPGGIRNRKRQEWLRKRRERGLWLEKKQWKKLQQSRGRR